MRSIVKLLMILALSLQLLSSPASAEDSKYSIITENLVRTNDYIAKLQAGANPDRIKRPELSKNNKWKAKRARREMNIAMDKAEALARSGRSQLIKLYYYPYQENYNYPDQGKTRNSK